MKPIDGTVCPNCGNDDLIQVADHEANGYNGYICKECKQEFGN